MRFYFFKVYCLFQWRISTYKEKTEHAFVCNVFFIFLTFPHSDENIRFLGIIQKAQKNTRISCNMGKCAKNPCVIFLCISLFVSFYTTYNSCANGSLKTQNWSIQSFIRPSVCLSVCLFICLSVCLSLCSSSMERKKMIFFSSCFGMLLRM